MRPRLYTGIPCQTKIQFTAFVNVIFLCVLAYMLMIPGKCILFNGSIENLERQTDMSDIGPIDLPIKLVYRIISLNKIGIATLNISSHIIAGNNTLRGREGKESEVEVRGRKEILYRGGGGECISFFLIINVSLLCSSLHCLSLSSLVPSHPSAPFFVPVSSHHSGFSSSPLSVLAIPVSLFAFAVFLHHPFSPSLLSAFGLYGPCQPTTAFVRLRLVWTRCVHPVLPDG